jgi:hypothetical protein
MLGVRYSILPVTGQGQRFWPSASAFSSQVKLQKKKTGIDVVLHAVSNPLQRSTKIKASEC